MKSARSLVRAEWVGLTTTGRQGRLQWPMSLGKPDSTQVRRLASLDFLLEL